MSAVRTGPTPCLRCGCHLVSAFHCNCGGVHSDYCVNCGRWTALPPDQYVNLGVFDARCDRGTEAHEHTSEEKQHRFDAVFAASRSTKR